MKMFTVTFTVISNDSFKLLKMEGRTPDRQEFQKTTGKSNVAQHRKTPGEELTDYSNREISHF